MSEQLNADKFNQLISELDDEIGNESNAHKDTLMALSLIMLRGKELRRMVRRERVECKFHYVKEYIMKKCPNAQFDLLRWHLFREGIISESYLIKINNIFVTVSFTFSFIFQLYLIWSKYAAFIDAKVPFSILGLIISIAITFIISTIIDSWRNSYLPSYFLLGHRKK